MSDARKITDIAKAIAWRDDSPFRPRITLEQLWAEIPWITKAYYRNEARTVLADLKLAGYSAVVSGAPLVPSGKKPAKRRRRASQPSKGSP